MIKINEFYTELKDSYLFSEIGKRIAAFTEANPDKKLIRLGIGDVTLPLPPSVIDAMHRAVDDMADKATFKGYGPEQGYPFLREAVAAYYAGRGVAVAADEVFVSDGAKSDVGNIGDILGLSNTVLIPDPVYPVYVDTNIMAGRKIMYLDSNEDNGFSPPPPDYAADMIYLCSPNNPTGSVYTKNQLAAWVKYAQDNKSLILFDAAYEAYIKDPSLPRSIYEIDGARSCAIEFCSLSKSAGFTGTRCAYTIVPRDVVGYTECGGRLPLHKLWNRRQTTKFNGVPYIIQRGAAAVFSEGGQAESRELVEYYMGNARIIRDTLEKAGITHFGGENAPYIWLKCPGGMDSWPFFDKLLCEAAIAGTPGAGFGKNGNGYFRLTAFGSRENTVEAAERLKSFFAGF